MSSTEEEQILGMINFSAISPNYPIRVVLFTNKQVLQVPLGKKEELGSTLAGVLGAIGFFALDSGAMFGIGGLVGRSAWGKFKKNVADKPVVSMQKIPVTPDILKAAVVKLPYEKVKEVKVKKIALESDWMVALKAGFLSTEYIVFDARGADDVKNLIRSTPLSAKMKEE